MSRSEYTDDLDSWALIRWRGAVKSAIRGARGQQFFKELLAALDAMPNKALIADELESDGNFCALGVLGNARNLDMSRIDPDDSELVAMEFNIAEALAREVVYMNDDGWWPKEEPSQRWERMRQWVCEQITPEASF